MRGHLLRGSAYGAHARVCGEKGRLEEPLAHSHYITYLGALAAEMLRWKRTEEGPGDNGMTKLEGLKSISRSGSGRVIACQGKQLKKMSQGKWSGQRFQMVTELLHEDYLGV